MSKLILSIHDLSCSIEGSQILKNISFSVAEGEYLSIVGPNGAGKSTLLRCISRLRKCSGEILLQGRCISEINSNELAKILAYVPQTFDASFPVTVFDFVLMGRFPYQRALLPSSPHDYAVTESILSELNLHSFRDRLISNLSGGERQKVLIGSALAQEPSILLLDEPTTFLDPRQEEEILDLLDSLRKKKGISILSVTHHLNSSVLHADRVLALRDGEVRYHGSAAEFVHPSHLESIYGKQFTIVRHPTKNVSMVLPG